MKNLNKYPWIISVGDTIEGTLTSGKKFCGKIRSLSIEWSEKNEDLLTVIDYLSPTLTSEEELGIGDSTERNLRFMKPCVMATTEIAEIRINGKEDVPPIIL